MGEEQLESAFSLTGATMSDWKEYDGRFDQKEDEQVSNCVHLTIDTHATRNVIF